MESAAFGLGIVLAILGPLLWIPVIWAVHRLVTRPLLLPRLERRRGRSLSPASGALVSAALVAVAAGASYLPGRLAFEELCAEEATPRIVERLVTDGVYVTPMFAYEAARYLREDGFAFVEAPDPYRKHIRLRYSLASDGSTRTEEVAELASRYGLRVEFSERPWTITLNRKTLYRMADDRELARAAGAVFHGGPLSPLLGYYALSSCPDPRPGGQGSRDFHNYYYLERIVLRGAAPK